MILPTQTTHYEWEILQNHHAFAACFIPPKRVPFNDPCINKPTHLHPQKLTWNLQNTHQKEKEKHLYTNTNHPFFGGGFKRLVLKGRLYFNQYPNNVCFFSKKKQHNTNLPDLLWRQAGQITVLNEATGFRAVVILNRRWVCFRRLMRPFFLGKGGNAQGGKLRNIK